MKIKIANPIIGGSNFTSIKKAQEYCLSGAAYFTSAGELRFYPAIQSRIVIQSAVSLIDCRPGMIYWNGARSKYVAGVDVAMYPPCCNVVFPKTGSPEAKRRYIARDKKQRIARGVMLRA
jgi:hypothetical protein